MPNEVEYSGQFQEHFMRAFFADILLPKNYEAKMN